MALPLPNIVFNAQDRGGQYMGKLNALAQAVNAAVNGVNNNDGPANTAYSWGNHATQGYLKSNDLSSYAYSKTQANARYATAAQGGKADSAIQSADLSSYAYSKAQGDSRYATAAQGGKADSAVQPGDLATVATSGNYNHLSHKPNLGTAAAANKVSGNGDSNGGRLITVDWYNANVSGSVDLSGYVKSADLNNVATSGNYNHLNNKPNLGSAAGKTAVTSDTDSTSSRLVDNGRLAKYVEDNAGGNIKLAPVQTLAGNNTVTYTANYAAHNFFIFKFSASPSVRPTGTYNINLTNVSSNGTKLVQGHFAVERAGIKGVFNINPPSGMTVSWLSPPTLGSGVGDYDLISFYSNPMDFTQLLLSRIDGRR